MFALLRCKHKPARMSRGPIRFLIKILGCIKKKKKRATGGVYLFSSCIMTQNHTRQIVQLTNDPALRPRCPFPVDLRSTYTFSPETQAMEACLIFFFGSTLTQHYTHAITPRTLVSYSVQFVVLFLSLLIFLSFFLFSLFFPLSTKTHNPVRSQEA